MAEIVLVHGVAQEQLSASTLKSAWLTDLAGGLENAERADLAEALTTNSDRVHMAFWGGLFLPASQRMGGPDDIEELLASEPELLELIVPLAEEWLEAVARADPDPDTKQTAEKTLQSLRADPGAAMGGPRSAMKRIAREMVHGFASIPWFADVGFGLAQLAISSLRQVSSYMSFENVDEGAESLRQEVLNKVTPLLDEDTTIVIGHSLGSVIAYDALRLTKQPIKLLITMGSPLGIPTVVYGRLQPKPPTYPSAVQHWLNVAAPDDIVAAVLDIEPLFTRGRPPNATFEGYVTDNGSKPHSATHYLTKPEVGAAIARALDSYA